MSARVNNMSSLHNIKKHDNKRYHFISGSNSRSNNSTNIYLAWREATASVSFHVSKQAVKPPPPHSFNEALNIATAVSLMHNIS